MEVERRRPELQPLPPVLFQFSPGLDQQQEPGLAFGCLQELQRFGIKWCERGRIEIAHQSERSLICRHGGREFGISRQQLAPLGAHLPGQQILHTVNLFNGLLP